MTTFRDEIAQLEVKRIASNKQNLAMAYLRESQTLQDMTADFMRRSTKARERMEELVKAGDNVANLTDSQVKKLYDPFG